MFPGEDKPGGDRQQAASAELFEQIYSQLRAVAQERLRAERRGHTLQATALVHEVWLRLVGDRGVEYAGRAQFFAAAVEAMRRILIDHARKRGAERRGGGRPLLRLEDGLDLASDEKIADAVSLDALILRLEKEDPRAALVVRLRYFAGLSIAETAAVIDVSLATVKNDWAYARAWLAEAWKERDDEQPPQSAAR